MLLIGYDLTLVNNHCLPSAQSVNGIAKLKQDVADVIPYLNSALGGSQCTQDPPSVTFKTEGKLISVQPDLITVNGVRDEEQARKIIDWMVREINEAWGNRYRITPHFDQPERPSIFIISSVIGLACIIKSKTSIGFFKSPLTSIAIFSMRCGTGVNGASPKVNNRIISKEKGILSSQFIQIKVL